MYGISLGRKTYGRTAVSRAAAELVLHSYFEVRPKTGDNVV